MANNNKNILLYIFYSYFIGNHINELDKRLRMIKLPRIVSRTLRPLSERDYYKAYEWKYVMLFAAYPILHDILDNRLFLFLFSKLKELPFLM